MQNPKNILITGASSGIGEALAYNYALKKVDNLFICGRNKERLQDVKKKCESLGTKTHAKIIDVSNKEEMEAWIAGIDKKTTLDLVFANAGISRGAKKGNETSQQTYDIFDININGVLNTVFPAIDIFRKNKKGQIAITSSIAGYKGLPTAPAYSASKACVKAWGEALRCQLARENIEVSIICPGFVKSRITDQNTCTMPFFMPAEKAASIISRRLTKNRGLITFPWQMRVAISIISALPNFITDMILSKLPEKS